MFHQCRRCHSLGMVSCKQRCVCQGCRLGLCVSWMRTWVCWWVYELLSSGVCPEFVMLSQRFCECTGAPLACSVCHCSVVCFCLVIGVVAFVCRRSRWSLWDNCFWRRFRRGDSVLSSWLLLYYNVFLHGWIEFLCSLSCAVCVFFLYTWVSIVPLSVLVSSTSRKAISLSFSFSIVNVMPSVMFLIVSNGVLMCCVLAKESTSST